MANKNAPIRPHLVDLTPPVFNDGKSSSRERGSSASRSSGKRRTSRSSPRARPAGAVRKNSEPLKKLDNRHIGKLSIAAIAIAGAVVWTTGSSGTFTPDPANQVPTMVPAASAPAFFFDDRSDALEHHVETRGNASFHHEKRRADAPQTIVTSEANAAPSTDMPLTTALLSIPDSLDKTGNIVTVSDTSGKPAITADVTSIANEGATQDAVATTMGTGSTLPDTGVTPAGQSEESAGLANSSSVKRITVKPGDTLSGILHQHGLKGERLRSLFTDELVKEHLSDIEVGQVLDITFNAQNQFKGLTTRSGYNTRINIEETASGFQASAVELPVERRQVVTAGRIDQSLYLAAEQANLKQSTIMELANIFQWELDFARDIRQDDKFSLLYEQLYREGEYIGDGDILAAEFVRGGKVYEAIRFTTEDGESEYYSPDGRSKRRTFMRHPVDVVRITSKFNPNRLHPVLHQIRAHRGVDYGSPHGSPIYATADGRVIYSGDKNAYGNTVILKHGEKFSTLYAHMSKISAKSKVGSRVRQGDVIGYVGNTGRVTGTHLHYEFRVNGKQIDPLKVELPAAAPIDQKYLAALQQKHEIVSVKLRTALDGLDSQLALSTDDADCKIAC